MSPQGPGAALAPLLVAAGAVPGAWLRFALVNRLAPRLPRRPWATLVVNACACLLLGVFMARRPAAGAGGPASLLLATGFLGSFSTFSTVMAELLDDLRLAAPLRAARLLLASLFSGWLALRLGQRLGA